MFSKAVSYGSLWDFAVPESVAESQKWVLSAMQKHGRELVTMLWRILGNEQDVCDAYQDTFLQLAHFTSRDGQPARRGGGGKPKYIKAYVFRVANNVAISMLRRRIAEKKRLFRPKGAEEITRSPANELDSKYLQETLRVYITQLPEHLRNVLTLRDLAEMSYGRIGKILGISPGTARVYRCKAIQLLSVWMNKEES
jgi:RNA polymerase sigma factor (sigma-70 family)